MLSRMEAGGHHLCALSLPYSSSPVSSRKEIVPSSGALICMVAAQGHI